MLVLIPCYFNNIQYRKERFNQVLESNLFFNNDIKVIWMNDEDPTIISNNIEYIKSELTNASVARNKLLNIFYNSDEEYCILSDDDTILLKQISVDDKDCVSYTNDYDKGFKQTEKISSAFLVLKNIKEYFDETLDANQDLDFGLMLVNKGYSVYRYSSDIVNINRGQSSMFKNKMYALHKKQEALKIINKKYDNKNIRTSKYR